MATITKHLSAQQIIMGKQPTENNNDVRIPQLREGR